MRPRSPDFDQDIGEADRVFESKRNRHGLTPEQIAAVLRAQGGVCAICGTSNPGLSNWSVDHDHSHHPGPFGCPLCFRGLLCAACNDALGKMKDDPVRLRAAATYIEQARARRRW